MQDALNLVGCCSKLQKNNHLIFVHRRIWNIIFLMMDMEKRKELKELVIGITRKKQRHHKICIKIQKDKANLNKK